MRLSLIFALIFLLSSSAPSAEKLKVVDDFYKESESLLKKADTAPSQKEKLLKDFENSLKSSLDQYEKKNPKLGDTEEDKVSVLYYTLEPVFKLLEQKKTSTVDCLRVRQEITTGDKMGRDEEAPSSKQALTAYQWLDLICPKETLSESTAE